MIQANKTLNASRAAPPTDEGNKTIARMPCQGKHWSRATEYTFIVYLEPERSKAHRHSIITRHRSNHTCIHAGFIFQKVTVDGVVNHT